jgi:hypothetical protein
MIVPPRESFIRWLKDVGYLYLIGLVFAALVFLFRDMDSISPSNTSEAQPIEENRAYYGDF